MHRSGLGAVSYTHLDVYKRQVPVVLLINPVKEQRMNEAIAAIEALDSIRAPVMRIRLEYLDSD